MALFKTEKPPKPAPAKPSAPDPNPDSDPRVRTARQRVEALADLGAPLRRQLAEMSEDIDRALDDALPANELAKLISSIEFIEANEDVDHRKRLLPAMKQRLAAAEAVVALVVKRAALMKELAPHDAHLAQAQTALDATIADVMRVRAYEFCRDHLDPKRLAVVAALETTARALSEWFTAGDVAKQAFEIAPYGTHWIKLHRELVAARRSLVHPMESCGE